VAELGGTVPSTAAFIHHLLRTLTHCWQRQAGPNYSFIRTPQCRSGTSEFYRGGAG